MLISSSATLFCSQRCTLISHWRVYVTKMVEWCIVEHWKVTKVTFRHEWVLKIIEWKTNWNFDFEKKKRFSILNLFFKMFEMFYIFIFWDFCFSKSSIFFRFTDFFLISRFSEFRIFFKHFEILRFQICWKFSVFFSKISRFSDFKIFQTFRIFHQNKFKNRGKQKNVNKIKKLKM